MGFLLMQYEYQRASREVSIHQRAGIRLNNQVTRYTKRVERMQSLFEKAKTKLDTQINTLQKDFSTILSTKATQLASLGNVAAAQNGFNGVLMGMKVGDIPLGAYVQYTSAVDTSADNWKQLLLSELSTAAATAQSVLSTLITALKEVETQKLEAQQDEQLTPISEKESDLQAEKDLEDTLCEMWKERKENAKSELADAIKGGMATYGLKG